MSKQNQLIEYRIVDNFGECIDVLPTREMARNTKRHLKEDFNEKVKIVQHRYQLIEQKVVR